MDTENGLLDPVKSHLALNAAVHKGVRRPTNSGTRRMDIGPSRPGAAVSRSRQCKKNV